MERLLDVFVLNLLWVVFSLPIFTIGASTCAAYSVTLKMVDEEEGYVARMFIKAFKENFKQGTIAWCIFGPLIYADWLLWQVIVKSENINFIAILGAILFTAVLIAANLYTYPLISRYKNSLLNMVKNSMGIAAQYFGRTVFIVALVALELAIIFWNKWTMIAGILIGPEFIIYTIGGISKRIFQQLDKNQ